MNIKLIEHISLKPAFFTSIKYLIHELSCDEYRQSVLSMTKINPLLAVDIYLSAEKDNDLEKELYKNINSLGLSLPIRCLISKFVALGKLGKKTKAIEVARYICFNAGDRKNLSNVDNYWIAEFVGALSDLGLFYLFPSFSKLVGKDRLKFVIGNENLLLETLLNLDSRITTLAFREPPIAATVPGEQATA